MRILAMIFNTLAVVAFFFSLVAMGVLACQVLEIPLAPFFKDASDHILNPMRDIYHAHYGHHLVTFYNHELDKAYGILIGVLLTVFMACLTVAHMFNRLQGRLDAAGRQMAQRVFEKKMEITQRKIAETELALKPIPIGALVVLSFQHLEDFPEFAKEVHRPLQALDRQQRVFTEGENRMLFRFFDIPSALLFLRGFSTDFIRDAAKLKLFRKERPVFRAVFHPLFDENGFFTDERFLWALLNIVQNNRIYMGGEGEEVLADLNGETVDNTKWVVQTVGTFQELGNRTYPTIYRLDFQKGPLPTRRLG